MTTAGTRPIMVAGSDDAGSDDDGAGDPGQKARAFWPLLHVHQNSYIRNDNSGLAELAWSGHNQSAFPAQSRPPGNIGASHRPGRRCRAGRAAARQSRSGPAR